MGSIPTNQIVREFTYVQLFKKSRHFTALLFGQIFSLLGSSITNVVLPIVVLQITNSTAMMGTVMAIYMAPFVIFLPFSGVLVDKMNKVNIMFFVDLVRFVLILSIIAFMDQLNMTFLFVFMFFIGRMEAF